MRIVATLLERLAVAFAAALFLAMTAGVPSLAANTKLDELYAQLADPDNPKWQRAQSDIQREWSKSGSPTMDLLLKRGQEAMQNGDLAAAIEHLTALTDHAPDFAEGWNARATAYFLAGLYGPSVADIQKTLSLNPHHFGALGGLAIILEQTGQDASALKAYRASLAIHPHQEGILEALKRLEQKTSGTDL
ncbi:MAG: tetratricopeptide repeat protein [Albidovulum sp.]